MATVTRKWLKTDLEKNTNKYWGFTAEELPNGLLNVKFGWGRVKENGDYSGVRVKVISKSELESKILEQETKDGYVEIDYGQSAVLDYNGKTVSDISGRVATLVQLLMEQANRSIYKYLNASLDSISLRVLNSADDILSLMDKNGVTAELLQSFYQTIPTKLPARIYIQELMREFDISEQRNRIAQMRGAVKYNNRSGQSLVDLIGAEIEEVSPHEDDYKWVVKKSNERDPNDPVNHKIVVTDVYRVRIPEERKSFTETGIGNVTRLFHGTSIGNVAHILRGGLKTEHSRYGLFGKGIYGADYMGKSCIYTDRISNAPNLMLVCDFALGNQMIASGEMTRIDKSPNGYDSVFAKKGHTNYNGRKVHQNEFIVYKNNQVTVTHIVVGRWQ